MKKTIQAKMTLLSPTGKTIVPVKLNYIDDEYDRKPMSEIQLIYHGVCYQGKGTDWFWSDAFADLQKNLPQGVRLACCMTCRHGNMCPYGNEVNQMFCTKEFVISNKMDMCKLFDTTDAYGRGVSVFNYCADFVEQSEDAYTYKDYLYYLKID